MKCVLAVLLSLLGIIAVNASTTKQSFRAELADQLRSSGYSLADAYGGDAYIVSVGSRTLKKTQLKDPEKLASVECSSPEGRYFVFHKNGGIWVRDTKSKEVEQIEAEGQYSTQCFSPGGKFVYSIGKMVRVYDLAKRKATDIEEGGSFPTWSPDGNWLGFDDGKHYVLLNQTTGRRKTLFSTKNSAGPDWSPDSRYLTYTKSGGSTGGFLFWGIKCIEPYRVWVWRVDDDEHDWVQQICKPGRAFTWIKDSELLSTGVPLPTSWHRVDAGPFSILAPSGWESHQLTGVDSYVGQFIGNDMALTFDFGGYSDGYLKKAKKPEYAVAHKSIGGFPAKVVSPRTPGHGITGVYFRNVGRSNGLCIFGKDLPSTQQDLALEIFDTIRFGGPVPRYVLPPPPAKKVQ